MSRNLIKTKSRLMVAAIYFMVFAIFIFSCSSGGSKQESTSFIDELDKISIQQARDTAIVEKDTMAKNASRVKSQVTKKHVKAQPPIMVHICDSKGAYAYHSHRCSGLENCKADIITMKKAQAENMGRRPCRKCY